MKNGLFITFEGCEGCGKTTQTALLSAYLKENGYALVETREPGGTALAERIREVLLDPESRVFPLAELLLYEAARAQHIEELILPSLAEGRIVLCDRFTDATLAYQGYGRGLDMAVIRKLNAIATRGTEPDLTLYLDIPPEQGLERARRTRATVDRLEREAIEFHRKVREGYLALAETESGRFKMIPAGLSIEDTHVQILEHVTDALKTHRLTRT